MAFNLSALFQGLFLGAGLIVAIGSQNAFVLKQGLKREKVFLVCIICALSDALLIAVGVSGTGTLVASSDLVSHVARVGGAIFLTIYGFRALIAAIHGEYLNLDKSESVAGSTAKIALTALAFTYLNPHVYLDTLVLLGSIAGQFDGDERMLFGLGAILASFVWFFSLGYGARLLVPLFSKPSAWRVLDLIIAMIMFILAAGLIKPFIV